MRFRASVVMALLAILMVVQVGITGERVSFRVELPGMGTLQSSRADGLAWKMSPNRELTESSLIQDFLTPCFGSYGGAFSAVRNTGRATFWHPASPPCRQGSVQLYRADGTASERSGFPTMAASVKMRIVGRADVSVGLTRYQSRSVTILDKMDMLHVDRMEFLFSDGPWRLYDANFSNWRKFDQHQVSFATTGLSLDAGYTIRERHASLRPLVGAELLFQRQRYVTMGAWVPYDRILGTTHLATDSPPLENPQVQRHRAHSVRPFVGVEFERSGFRHTTVGLRVRYLFGDSANTYRMPYTWRGSYPVSTPLSKITAALTIGI